MVPVFPGLSGRPGAWGQWGAFWVLLHGLSWSVRPAMPSWGSLAPGCVERPPWRSLHSRLKEKPLLAQALIEQVLLSPPSKA